MNIPIGFYVGCCGLLLHEACLGLKATMVGKVYVRKPLRLQYVLCVGALLVCSGVVAANIAASVLVQMYVGYSMPAAAKEVLKKSVTDRGLLVEELNFDDYATTFGMKMRAFFVDYIKA